MNRTTASACLPDPVTIPVAAATAAAGPTALGGDAGTAAPRGARLDVLLEILQERGQPYSHAQTAGIICKLAEALEQWHRSGILHGDIRLSNVRMLDLLQPVLAGFPCHAQQPAPMSSRAGLDTRSPEQALQQPADARTDVFALGAVMYEMLLGRAPLRSADTLPAYLHACATLTPPAVLAPSVPLALSAIAMRALRPLPQQRYARAADMAVDLQRYLKHESRGAPVPQALPATNSLSDTARALSATVHDLVLRNLRNLHNLRQSTRRLVPLVSGLAVFLKHCRMKRSRAGRQALAPDRPQTAANDTGGGSY